MIPLRPAARAAILTPDFQILLVRFVFGELTFWAPPGGGLEGHETHEAALRRELLEETGLETFDLGPLLYTHKRTFEPPTADGFNGQHDRVWRVDVLAPFDPSPELSLAELFSENVGELRWFDLEALRGVVTLPLELPDLLRRIAAGESGPWHIDEIASR